MRPREREIPVAAEQTAAPPLTLAETRTRMVAAEDALRAIGAGEVDAFVVADGESGQRVFTLSTADRPYRMFVENMRDAAATVTTSGLIVYANRRLAELLACSRETIVGSSLAAFIAGDPIGLEEMRGPGGLGATVEFELLDADGIPVPVLVGSSPLDVDGDQLTCLTFTDLSDRKAQDREIARLGKAQAERLAELQDAQIALTRQATHDALTGLPNRALLVDRIEQALSRSKRSGGCVAVLFVDLDRFKQVNDNFGHAAGDDFLRHVADTLVGCLRPMDTVARIGGDEFVVLAPDIESHVRAVDMGARLVAALANRTHRAAIGEGCAASVGISVSSGGSGAAEGMLAEADKAMYQAKSRGGARAEIFDPALREQVQQRAASLRVLQSALDERRVAVYYQPIIDVATGEVAGFEALARIVKHDGSILPPADFVPVAEDSGLVMQLGAQVLGMACDEALRWQPTELPAAPLPVAVNLSSRQFEPGDLPVLVRQSLKRTGLDPSCLHLELTETAVMDLRPDVLRQLEALRDLGIEIGLDDFGTGYASLTHLRRLPLTFVKIDRSFVSGLVTDHDDEGIVSAVVDLAANLGLRSIAEGVETRDQLNRLRDMGCDQAQGYLFARPSPPCDLSATIQQASLQQS
jgi:diguanylate cyclase (GGDEF)-like protein/PAS domain S-box-containing protein